MAIGYSGSELFKLVSLTVSALPAANSAIGGESGSAVGSGLLAFVRDATTTTRGSTVVGGGSNKVLVYSDGTNWIIV